MSKTALLLVSFGTTYKESRDLINAAFTKSYQDAFPDVAVFIAYTSKIVRKRILAKEGIQYDDVNEAIERIIAAGFDKLVVQSLHIIPGKEFQLMIKELSTLTGKFDSVTIGRPLLDEFDDFRGVVKQLTKMGQDHSKQALVFMGHGTSDHSFTTYACLDHMLQDTNVYMGAVESYPDLEIVIEELNRQDVKDVVLKPFMIVSGNHVHNDMASQQKDSWYSRLQAAVFNVETDLGSLGMVPSIRQAFIEHTRQALDKEVTL
ncbi:sirohydrochlorin cobaltochelatase [Furfurilactobacillus siliginis]|uniref:Cobalamin biosynthesis protein CbiK, Co2+ chelatase n=1 Tax=Furfurilactobacillus siliginis TaxID=348151 RepID=A0A0R2L476_9LACO|nr:sirohydrochlorin cobaltochelatase [Furfurilactobacillus siliginis]KRN96192.1 cobalamin biosynthesis protein CbiK, Co2+ chelatase [Furfurilactobacillus siliginis]GEK27883.1 sirohydrochlorin cobaltochelatase [Furfurilactobacillus siliginis]